MRCISDLYKYLSVWVDDLAIVSKDPKLSAIKTPVVTYKFYLKGAVGPLEHHLRCDYVRDINWTVPYTPKKYNTHCTRILKNYGKPFEQPKGKPLTPLKKKNDSLSWTQAL